jgi:hypothetical protein
MSTPSRSILSSLFGTRSNDNAAPGGHDGVQVGDRFYKVGRWESIWVVQRLFTPDGNTALHAKIVRDGHPGDVTIISTETLLDDTAYKPDRRTREERDKHAPARRRSDDPRLRR